MGQEIHRQGLITNTSIDGCEVIANIDMTDPDFFINVLSMQLSTIYPGSEMSFETVVWGPYSSAIKIKFTNREDALHFHLKHHE
jgi:hypothetical protein